MHTNNIPTNSFIYFFAFRINVHKWVKRKYSYCQYTNVNISKESHRAHVWPLIRVEGSLSCPTSCKKGPLFFVVSSGGPPDLYSPLLTIKWNWGGYPLTCIIAISWRTLIIISKNRCVLGYYVMCIVLHRDNALQDFVDDITYNLEFHIHVFLK